jgi:N6-L-threonylcarbamoyladenine synthase
MIAYAGWQRLRAGQHEPLSFAPRARWAMESLPGLEAPTAAAQDGDIQVVPA